MRSQGYVCTRGALDPRHLGLLVAMLAISICVIGMNASMALALSPSVETVAASSIAEKGATLNGKVNPNGAETKAYFEYGTTTSYGSKTAEVNVGSGTTALEHSQAISGLSANTTYHYRIVATNASGSSQGADKTFTTVAAPTVSFFLGGYGEGEEVTVKGFVDPNGQSTTYQYEYGTKSGSYTNVFPMPEGSAGSGYESVMVDQKIPGLTLGTTYYMRLSATNASGKAVSEEVTYLSSKHPGIQIQPATVLSRTEAALGATIQPNESATKYWFEYGTTTSYGSKTTTKEISKEVTSSAVGETLKGLKTNTLYHYRVVTENSIGSHISADQIFTTPTTATLYLKGGAEPLKLGVPLKVFSTNLTFSGDEKGSHSCNETELSGFLGENPGAAQSVTASKMQNSGSAFCPWYSTLSIKSSIPKGPTIEYGKTEAGEGLAWTSKFVLVQAVYHEKLFKFAECEYNLVLAGTFTTKAALEPTLSGKTEVVKGNAACPGVESVTGKFVVTSSGSAVEAK
jgi:hypothetical protein